MASNAIVAGNSNALKDPLDHYDSVKEFFAIELDAFIIAATLNHFRIESVESIPTKNLMPDNLKNSSKEVQRKLLQGEVISMIEKFVMSGVSRLPNLLAAYNPHPDLACRGQGCTRVFKYGKCCVKHEKKEHGLTVADEDATS